MSQLSAKLRSLQGGSLMFFCPGCQEAHAVSTPGWTFNGDVEKPTFVPSILVRSGHYAKATDSCWCTYNKEHPENPTTFKCYQCHSFVTNGRIQFLGDSTHALANQTVDLPDLPDYLRDA